MRTPALIAFLAVVPASLAGQPQQPPQVEQLLNDTKSLVSLLKSDIATLGFFVSESASSTNAAMLNLYAERIKSLRALAGKLEAARKDGSHAQQTALDRIVPVMKEFASSADTALAAAKQSPAVQEQYFKLNSDLAEELCSVISAWVDYAKTKDDLDRVARPKAAPNG
jgi:hypothetical protein